MKKLLVERSETKIDEINYIKILTSLKNLSKFAFYSYILNKNLAFFKITN